jgi:hypothetical protein
VDALWQTRSHVFVLAAETGRAGADALVMRLLEDELFDPAIPPAVAVFPDDALTVQALVTAVTRARGLGGETLFSSSRQRQPTFPIEEPAWLRRPTTSES